jgi:hypothetical protein
VKRLLSSYRWRRRLAWMAVVAAVVVGAVVTGLQWPNTAPKEAGPKGKVRLNYQTPKHIRLNVHDKALALAVASRFIDTAVARKDVDKAWDLVSPELRAGVSRKEWDNGSMPIPPFPVQQSRWKLSYSDVEGIGFQMALFPTKSSHQRAEVFLIELRPVRSGKTHSYLVSSWQAAPTNGVQTGLANTGFGPQGTPVEQASPRVSRALGNKARLSAAWLLLPLGLLSLVVIVPLAIGGVNWYRGYRARAKLGL